MMQEDSDDWGYEEIELFSWQVEFADWIVQSDEFPWIKTRDDALNMIFGRYIDKWNQDHPGILTGF